jgi:hypothetical protein
MGRFVDLCQAARPLRPPSPKWLPLPSCPEDREQLEQLGVVFHDNNMDRGLMVSVTLNALGVFTERDAGDFWDGYLVDNILWRLVAHIRWSGMVYKQNASITLLHDYSKTLNAANVFCDGHGWITKKPSLRLTLCAMLNDYEQAAAQQTTQAQLDDQYSHIAKFMKDHPEATWPAAAALERKVAQKQMTDFVLELLIAHMDARPRRPWTVPAELAENYFVTLGEVAPEAEVEPKPEPEAEAEAERATTFADAPIASSDDGDEGDDVEMEY